MTRRSLIVVGQASLRRGAEHTLGGGLAGKDRMAADNATTYTRRWCGTGEIAFPTLSSGTRLRYLKVGTGLSLLLLHTLRTQLAYFQRHIPKFTSHFTVYAVDLPGLAWSDISPTASYESPSVRTGVV